MLKKSERMSLEEATRLAILGKLPLKESKEVKTESTTVSTTGDGLTTVETDDANIVIEPKDNAAVEVGMPVEPCVEPECELPVEVPVEEVPVEEIPVEEPIIDEPVEEVIEDELEENKKLQEGEAPLFKNVISKHDIKKEESKEVKTETKSIKVRMVERKLEESSSIQVVEEYTIDELDSKLWSGAEDRWVDYTDEQKEYIVDMFNESYSYADSIDNMPSLTTFNDFVWFDADDLLVEAGLAEDEDADLEESKKLQEGEAPLFKDRINKVDIKKEESKKIEEGEAPLFKDKINKTDIKKEESKEKVEEKEPKKHIINKVDLRKVEAKKKEDLNDHLKTKVAEGLTKFVKEAYANGKEVKVEKVLKLTENKLYVKGNLVMENSTRDFSCKLIPVMENKTFRKYTINENKILKITEGKTSKGKSFNLVIKK